MACSMVLFVMDNEEVDRLDIACNAGMWLLVIGFGITFSALFAKTFRINRIMANARQFRRVKLTVRDTVLPVVIIFLCE